MTLLTTLVLLFAAIEEALLLREVGDVSSSFDFEAHLLLAVPVLPGIAIPLRCVTGTPWLTGDDDSDDGGDESGDLGLVELLDDEAEAVSLSEDDDCAASVLVISTNGVAAVAAAAATLLALISSIALLRACFFICASRSLGHMGLLSWCFCHEVMMASSAAVDILARRR